MNCRAAREWARMRRDLPAGAEGEHVFRAHVSECARCAAYAADCEQLTALVGAAPLAEPSSNFDWRLKLRLSKLERDGAPPLFDAPPARTRPQLEFWGAAAAAAMVVVAVGLATLRPETSTMPVPTSRSIARTMPIDAGAQVRPVASGRVVGPQAPLSYSSFFVEEPAAPVAPADSAAPTPMAR